MTLIITLRLSVFESSLGNQMHIKYSHDANPSAEKVCRLHPGQEEFEPISMNAFAVVTQHELPRAYHIGFESFLKHNPNTTLYIYGNLGAVDERFGDRVVLVPIDIADIQRQLVEAVPELDQAVFQTEIWHHKILPSMQDFPMIRSDFMRLSLLFLYGGSWLDADAIYLRPFTMRNALPCHQEITSGQGNFWIQCEADGTLHSPFNDSMPVIPGQTFYCTNGILGQFAARHPFLRKALLQMASLYPDLNFNPDLKNIALGGHLFVTTMITTSTTEGSLRLSEWPLMYDINQMFGFWNVNKYIEQHNENVPEMIADLDRRRAFSVQLYHSIYEHPEVLQFYFQSGKLHYELWQRNCLFSCDEPIG